MLTFIAPVMKILLRMAKIRDRTMRTTHFAATLIAAAMLGELAPPSAYAQFVWIGSLLVFTTVSS